ncbi:MAG TPA: hypothetical protein VGI86_11325 [Acidimicrobiia bacterium]|jgi:hypothetical protein
MADEGARETTPSDATRAAEEAEAQRAHVPDRAPTDEETEDAEAAPRDKDAGAHYDEMAKRGANQQGEGRLP